MVRLSNENDLNGIISLWMEAFNDSENDVKFFLKNYYCPDNIIVYDYNGEIASVLFLLDGYMHIKGKDYPSYYLYAACTLKKYRGRGIMSQMLDYSKNLSLERNKFFIALKPAEESLYNYYSKFGYKPVFTMKKANYKQTENADLLNIVNDEPEVAFSSLRDIPFKNFDYFKWNNMSVDFAINHHKYYGGKIVVDCNGYLLYSIHKGILNVKETTFSDSDLKKYLNYVLEKHNLNDVCCYLPYFYDFECDSIEKINSGMLLPICKEADELILSVNNAYLSLTLD